LPVEQIHRLSHIDKWFLHKIAQVVDIEKQLSGKRIHNYLRKAVKISPEHPTVLSKFLENAKEIEMVSSQYLMVNILP